MKKIIIASLLSLAFYSCESKVHKNFDINEKELIEAVSSLPQDIQENVKANPSGFLDGIEDLINTSQDLLLLVDKKHNLGSDYAPEDLVLLSTYPELFVRKGREQMLMMREILIENLIQMSKDADKLGIELELSSCYRSYSTQQRTFNYWVSIDGEEIASTYSARPGASQHQLGTAVDFGSIEPEYEFTPAGQWLYKNAWKYGFSLSYPKDMDAVTGYIYEIWHYRYIGREAAAFEVAFFNRVQQYMLEFWHYNKDFFIEKYIGA
ncbi:MAG: M15 family metallopeptidase [Spirochaetales bacterium]|nr:M15 family metallopeptidase [Spirochaetales bacterium]